MIAGLCLTSMHQQITRQHTEGNTYPASLEFGEAGGGHPGGSAHVSQQLATLTGAVAPPV